MIRASFASRRGARLALLLAALLPGLAACGGGTDPLATAIPLPATATPIPATPFPATPVPGVTDTPQAAASLPPATDTPTTLPPAPTAPPTAAPTDVPPEPTNTAFPDLPTVTPQPTTGAPGVATGTPAPSTPGPKGTPMPIGTPVPAAGGTIVFVLGHELALVNPDGSGLQHLGITGDLTAPRWSPDHRRIAFVKGYLGAGDLWVANRDGSDAHALASTPAYREADPRWSPDGRTVAYTRTGDTNHDGQIDTRDTSEVWVVDAAAGNARRLTDGMDPAWAPDGKRLAFATAGRRTGEYAYGEGNTIDMVNYLGQNRWSPIKIAAIPQDTSLVNPAAKFNAATTFVRFPDWSPSNRAVAFMAQGHSGLIVTATDKGENPTLRDFDYEGGYGRVFWSPDGARLVYEVEPASGVDLVAVMTLGSKSRVEFGSPHDNTIAVSPSWAPDSRSLVYVQATQAAEQPAAPVGALVVADASNPAARRVIVAQGASEPDWR